MRLIAGDKTDLDEAEAMAWFANAESFTDTNGNGKWDPGQYPGNKKLPEIVWLIPKELSVRAGWDNEMNIQL
jgi:hypothetical protein